MNMIVSQEDERRESFSHRLRRRDLRQHKERRVDLRSQDGRARVLCQFGGSQLPRYPIAGIREVMVKAVDSEHGCNTPLSCDPAGDIDMDDGGSNVGRVG
jgi:hypothetical protein